MKKLILLSILLGFATVTQADLLPASIGIHISDSKTEASQIFLAEIRNFLSNGEDFTEYVEKNQVAKEEVSICATVNSTSAEAQKVFNLQAKIKGLANDMTSNLVDIRLLAYCQ